MTEAIKCDRCYEYDLPEQYDYTKYKDPNGLDRTKNKKKDLCRDCIEELEEWWRNDD